MKTIMIGDDNPLSVYEWKQLGGLMTTENKKIS